MGILLRLFTLFLGIMFSLTVINLLIKRKMSEKNSLLWLIGSFLVFIVTLFPQILEWAAEIIGVDYPPTLLFLSSTIIVLLIALFHSMQISILNEQVKELTQYTAINEFIKNKNSGLSSSYKEEEIVE